MSARNHRATSAPEPGPPSRCQAERYRCPSCGLTLFAGAFLIPGTTDLDGLCGTCRWSEHRHAVTRVARASGLA